MGWREGEFFIHQLFSFMGMLFNLSILRNLVFLAGHLRHGIGYLPPKYSSTLLSGHIWLQASGTGAHLSWGPTSCFSQCNAQAVTSLGIPSLSCLINVLPVCLIHGSGSRGVAFQEEVMKRGKPMCFERRGKIHLFSLFLFPALTVLGSSVKRYVEIPTKPDQ